MKDQANQDRPGCPSDLVLQSPSGASLRRGVQQFERGEVAPARVIQLVPNGKGRRTRRGVSREAWRRHPTAGYDYARDETRVAACYGPELPATAAGTRALGARCAARKSIVRM